MEAFQMLKEDSAVFVDVRHADFYKYEHIPRAISVPYRVNQYWDEERIHNRLDKLEKTCVIIV